jgi:hypothetical protein
MQAHSPDAASRQVPATAERAQNASVTDLTQDEHNGKVLNVVPDVLVRTHNVSQAACWGVLHLS